MNTWLSMLGCSPEELERLVLRALDLKSGQPTDRLKNRHFVGLFFNPSLRTRLSFETAMKRNGGFATTLAPGNESWSLEFQDNVVMNGDKPEHVKEAARVISRYADAIGVRSFAGLLDLGADRKETVLNAFAEYATVPVVNMESALEHPCQALGDMVTIREKLKESRKKRFVLSWAPHTKPLPLAVPHSAILAGAFSGMDVTVACPEGYRLAEEYNNAAQKICQKFGTNFSYTSEQIDACRGADILYVKSWGATNLYGDKEAQSRNFSDNRDWCVSRKHLGLKTLVMHCLPVRRNLELADEVLDSAASVVIDEAENRLWAQTAILEHIFGAKKG